MKVFERFIARECPPENGSVLWINTSVYPVTLNWKNGCQWEQIGGDSESIAKILSILGEFEDSDNTVAKILEYLNNFFTPITEQEIHNMFVINTGE